MPNDAAWPAVPRQGRSGNGNGNGNGDRHGGSGLGRYGGAVLAIRYL